jgi:hypothetical protein
MSTLDTPTERKLRTGKRVYRSLLIALFVGFVSMVVSLVPAAFMQTVFAGAGQVCPTQEELAEQIATQGQEPTVCVESPDLPVQVLSTSLVAGGGLLGFAGGFIYGMFNPDRRQRQALQSRYLPF